MKFGASLALAFSATATLVSAGIGGVAGSIDNSAEAASLQSAAATIEEGSYTFTNAKTGKSLHYVREGNHITPSASSSSSSSAVTVLHHGGGVSWVRLAIGDKNKCLSSQWGGSYNLAGVMYACAVDSGGEVTRLGNTLEPTKQWWLLVPVDSYDASSFTSSNNHALFAAQEFSVKTREKANGISKRHRQFGDAGAHGLVARQSRERKSWRDRVAEQKAATSSKSSGSKKVASKTKKVESKVAKPKALAAAPAQEADSDDDSSSPSAPDGQRYFIIPTDHLIDMHTLALTGHEIESFGNTQSTALDAWDPTEEEQQWIITRA